MCLPCIPLLRISASTDVLVCTYQAISGAGKTFETWPEMLDNVIPYIGGEEEKSEQEPLKMWGQHRGRQDRHRRLAPSITAQCLRVPVSDGHMARGLRAASKISPLRKKFWQAWSELPRPAHRIWSCPARPKQFLHYFEENDRPQTRAGPRCLKAAWPSRIGRLREDTQYDYKFVCLSHNTLRGAAGGGVLLAELLCCRGLF